MQCPQCRAKTDVAQTWETARGTERKRQRICVGPHHHKFQTVERVNVSVNLEELLVRHRGDNSLSEATFDRTKMHGDVRRGVLGTLDEQQLYEVVDDAVRRLESKLDDVAEELTAEEQAARHPARYAIADAEIRLAVEHAFQLREHQLPYVLFALSTLGRRDRTGRVGFQNAVDVLKWIDRTSEEEVVVDEHPDHDAPPKVYWTPPSGKPPLPRAVIKRDKSSHSFDYDKFLSDIRKAMTGRIGAGVLSTQLAKWVLWNLAGQRHVLSSQLVAGVTSGLRRVDDIAYLRWVAVEKNIHQLRDLIEEAEALIDTPSPRLQFVDSVTEI